MNRRDFLRNALSAAVAATLPPIPLRAFEFEAPPLPKYDLRAEQLRRLGEWSAQRFDAILTEHWFAIVSPAGEKALGLRPLLEAACT